ncbi:MAG: protein-export rane protein SecF, preprotein translocase subunit SecF [Candidatus Paceibacter sp.]|jgi:preprotein translocase subunit SecF|nr:protein-export rane protein SecF, preprotein translocase subunit SecF [Candidatus Paceibacter sp.]
MFVVQYRKIWFILSAVLLVVSIAAMVGLGFNFGIDFKGGTITQVSYSGSTVSPLLASTTTAVGRPEQTQIQESLDKLEIGNYVLQPTGDNAYLLRTRELSNDEKAKILAALSLNDTRPVTVDRYDSIGPVVGNELKKKAVTAVIVVILCIVLFITYAFRKVSEPVQSWKYGLATVIALLHDVIIPTGIFIIYIHFTGGEIDILFVSAILSVLGYSVHDSIVVFDRVRENLQKNKEEKIKEDFETTVGKSVSETFGRSINTSVTIFLVLLVLFLIGGETTKDFAFVLLLGVIIGTYSSIFVGSPLLVVFEKWQKKI